MGRVEGMGRVERVWGGSSVPGGREYRQGREYGEGQGYGGGSRECQEHGVGHRVSTNSSSLALVFGPTRTCANAACLNDRTRSPATNRLGSGVGGQVFLFVFWRGGGVGSLAIPLGKMEGKGGWGWDQWADGFSRLIS